MLVRNYIFNFKDKNLRKNKEKKFTDVNYVEFSEMSII